MMKMLSRYIAFFSIMVLFGLPVYGFKAAGDNKNETDIGTFSVFATDHVTLRESSSVLSGNIGVKHAGTEPWFDSHAEVTVKKGVYSADGVTIFGDSVKINKNASVDDIYYNDLKNRGTIRGVENNSLVLPLEVTIPEIPLPSPGSNSILIKRGKSATLVQGSYGEVKVRNNGTLILVGGVYHFQSIQLGKNANLYFQDVSELIVNSYFRTQAGSMVVPEANSSIEANKILIYINGEDEPNKKGNRLVKTVKLGNHSLIKANVFAPNGSIAIRHDSAAEGAFIGKTVLIGKNVTVSLNSAFGGPTVDQGLAAVSVGDLAQTSLSSDNIFTYEIIEGDFIGSTNTIQLTEVQNTNGHFLQDQTPGINIKLLKLSSDLMIAVVTDVNFTDRPALFVSYIGSPPDEIDGNYNMFALSAVSGNTAYGSFHISQSGSEMLADFAGMQLNFLVSKDPELPYLYTSEIISDGDEFKDLNLICDGNSIVIDSPVNSFLGQGFGLAVKSENLQSDDFLSSPTFYLMDIEYGFGSGTFHVENGIVSYELNFDSYTENGELVLNPQNCNGIELPNNGSGWVCTSHGTVALIDTHLGSVYFSHSLNRFSLGGW